MLTSGTRRASFDKMKPKIPSRAQEILNVLADGSEMTPREIMHKLGYTDLNMVRPRLTELLGSNLVKTAGTRYDTITERHVSVYKAV